MIKLFVIIPLAVISSSCFSQTINIYCDNDTHYEINERRGTVTVDGRRTLPAKISKDEVRFENVVKDDYFFQNMMGDKYLQEVTFIIDRKRGVLLNFEGRKVAVCEREQPLKHKF